MAVFLHLLQVKKTINPVTQQQQPLTQV